MSCFLGKRSSAELFGFLMIKAYIFHSYHSPLFPKAWNSVGEAWKQGAPGRGWISGLSCGLTLRPPQNIALFSFTRCCQPVVLSSHAVSLCFCPLSLQSSPCLRNLSRISDTQATTLSSSGPGIFSCALSKSSVEFRRVNALNPGPKADGNNGQSLLFPPLTLLSY